jgi:AhpD family alkylhydroperoxidase
MVPNAFATIGSNSPVALEAALNLDAALGKSSLSAKQIEVIKLAVSAVAHCDYCLAAHTMIGKHAGLSRETILAVRHGQPSGDTAIDAFASFVETLVSTSGTIPSAAVAAVKAASYSDAQVIDTLLAIASITFTNLVNRVNDTVLDFPAAD